MDNIHTCDYLSTTSISTSTTSTDEHDSIQMPRYLIQRVSNVLNELMSISAGSSQLSSSTISDVAPLLVQLSNVISTSNSNRHEGRSISISDGSSISSYSSSSMSSGIGEADHVNPKRVKLSSHYHSDSSSASSSASSSPSLVVKQSSIAANGTDTPIGLGLFVAKGHTYCEGQYIVSFESHVQMTRAMLQGMDKCDPRKGYILQITKEVFWDLRLSARAKSLLKIKTPDGVFVNASHNAHFLGLENSSTVPSKNCKITVSTRGSLPTAKIYATKHIDASSGDVELLTCYGAAYWNWNKN